MILTKCLPFSTARRLDFHAQITHASFRRDTLTACRTGADGPDRGATVLLPFRFYNAFRHPQHHNRFLQPTAHGLRFLLNGRLVCGSLVMRRNQAVRHRSMTIGFLIRANPQPSSWTATQRCRTHAGRLESPFLPNSWIWPSVIKSSTVRPRSTLLTPLMRSDRILCSSILPLYCPERV